MHEQDIQTTPHDLEFQEKPVEPTLRRLSPEVVELRRQAYEKAMAEVALQRGFTDAAQGQADLIRKRRLGY